MGNTTPDFLIYLFLFGCAVMFFIGFMNGPPTPKSSKSTDWDMVTIGSIKPVKPVKTKTKIVYVDRPVKRVTTKSKPVVKSKHPLYNEAIDAMVSLGEKKGIAKVKADKLFSTHNPKDLNEVITLVFKNDGT